VTERLRVLLVPSAYYPNVGGIEELTRQLARALRARGHATGVVTNRWPADAVQDEQIDGSPVRRIRFQLPDRSARGMATFAIRGPRSVRDFLGTVRGFRPDVVHLIGAGPNAAYAAALQPLLAAPVVLTAQGEYGFDAHAVFARSFLLRRALRHLLQHAAALTACSAYVLDELRRDFAIRIPATVIPNGVDPKEFGAAQTGTDDLGQYVFAAARLVHGKGLDVLVRAVAAAGPALGDLRLVVGGDGPERPRLERLAADLGIAPRVSFLGSLERARLTTVMGRATAFALPSRAEPFGIALLEAMAAGVPAVATRAGGVTEFAQHERNALLVPPTDEHALAEALVRLVRDPTLAQTLAASGRVTASDLSWARIVLLYEDVYRSVARG
jgi:glycogen(starch) synthase